ncbi:radical SAM family heme chaperone HemW [Alkalihalobacillus oceani]|uniref:radical SAM family heme chaperone HemW n=1 Tax=Halalkalibacter oceani TaxID=1653776 RepID=UPI00203FD7FB|nr:radical SAM family heme chaperone HemW [Halalkalibacter oceani]MCM3761529.1 radical SAM family heme chaperone HemW [Halalkalibacter oceani]
MRTAAYVHIPFCEQICYYCDFNKVFLKNQPVDEYIEALLLEMERTLEAQPTDRLKTIYIGGGTPTALSAEQLQRLLTGMRTILPLAEVEEYTVEVNPDSLDDDKITVLKEGGVNRLSLGVQSFDEGLLQEIGRTHSRQSIISAVERSRKAGLTNLSLDLMFGLPTQTPGQFAATLAEALRLDVPHLSAYSLKIEEKTVFYNRQRKGRLQLPPEEDEVKMYEQLRRDTARAGLIQYEISNFAKVGYESRHNLVYWNNEEYYGFGAGAHGYVDGIRHQNHGPLPKYLQAIRQKEAPVLVSHLVTRVERIEEELFMGLRKRDGISRLKFEEKYGRTLEAYFNRQIDDLVERGLLEVTPERIALTEQGLLLGNEVFEQFIAVLDEGVIE